MPESECVWGIIIVGVFFDYASVAKDPAVITFVLGTKSAVVRRERRFRRAAMRVLAALSLAPPRERQLTMRSCVMRPNDTLRLILLVQGHYGCNNIKAGGNAVEILRQIISHWRLFKGFCSNQGILQITECSQWSNCGWGWDFQHHGRETDTSHLLGLNCFFNTLTLLFSTHCRGLSPWSMSTHTQYAVP